MWHKKMSFTELTRSTRAPGEWPAAVCPVPSFVIFGWSDFGVA